MTEAATQDSASYAGQPVIELERDGVHYTLLGTAHVSKASIDAVKAATDQMRKLPFYHSFTAKSHEPMIDLAEMLIERAPVPMSKVFFGNSGSEANDSALKMIWYMNNALGRPKKKKVFARLKAYHGITLAAASLTGLPANHKLFDAPIANGRFIHVGTPHHYHEAKPGES